MIRRYIHSSCVVYSTKKLGIKLCKMINPSNNRRWVPSQSIDINALPTVKSLTKTKNVPNNRGVRRLAMLNKLFMKYITDIMSTGSISFNIVGHGIEISKVQVAQDYQTVNVYWICKGDLSDDQTEALLNSSAGHLRHELSTLRLMGEVPYITFVKDKQEAQLVDLNRRLAIADYGEDYTPTELGHLLKSEFMLNMKLSPEIQAKIKQTEAEHLRQDNNEIDDPIPEMNNSVYGLDHAKITIRLLASRKKVKDAWAKLDSESPVISYRAVEVAPTKIDVAKQKKDLAEFLLQRQILQNKLHKEKRSRDTSGVGEHQNVADENVEDIDEFCDDYNDEYELEQNNIKIKS